MPILNQEVNLIIKDVVFEGVRHVIVTEEKLDIQFINLKSEDNEDDPSAEDV